ncbi:histidinol dehydrogenase [Aliiglaciecola sp. 2_MG-2023]|uniref:histidinol dehydrogenase n=1 Tax=unclassified Aliiglaciecola TaxID=2593648 RepID=UPI0026E25349|nr:MULTISPECIES: histidinol dehydrogenase [unclassified Aliiglaciecola]MDO6712273.1 histidinol dehydrogenase [Aliiglaciecola sp. 2_MG-2023]MDO6753321.1 histidinol dehydrogenase [Aliiglaciecola sp. 1_MG-2023]
MQNWANLSDSQKQNILSRPAQADNEKLTKIVSDILQQVKERGDDAVRELTEQFDGIRLTKLRLSNESLINAANEISDNVRTAIDLAYANIKAFHQAQFPTDVKIETQPGVLCELKHSAIDSVGLYIPGGSAPLPSTVLMLGATAQVAGCERKVLCTPPDAKGNIAAEIRYAAQLCGIDEIYLIGGAQAVAAMAFGTDSITKVDKIFGPGNSFVTEAKQQISTKSDGAAIDMPAGPSEVLVIADESADPNFVASDLLSQAEHGADSQAVLVSNSQTLIEAVQLAVEKQLQQLSRKEIAAKAMQHGRYILTSDVNESILVSNQYAPEHLIVQVENARDLLPKLKYAGSIFIGKWSPESAGDYASGTNHVLPTYGYSRNYSSLGLADFMRRYTVQELSYQGLSNIGNAIMDLAEAEGLDAHKRAVSIRLNGDSV